MISRLPSLWNCHETAAVHLSNPDIFVASVCSIISAQQFYLSTAFVFLSTGFMTSFIGLVCTVLSKKLESVYSLKINCSSVRNYPGLSIKCWYACYWIPEYCYACGLSSHLLVFFVPTRWVLVAPLFQWRRAWHADLVDSIFLPCDFRTTIKARTIAMDLSLGLM